MSSLVNSGTIRKSAGSASLLVDIPFTGNGGTVAVDAGTIQFRNNLTSNAATFNAASIASILFPNSVTYAFNGGTAFLGTGVMRITAGTAAFGGLIRAPRLEFAGGNMAVDEEATIIDFVLTGGTMSGAGRLTLSGTSTWSGGLMTGGGTTVVASGATLNLTGGDKDLVNRGLENNGTVVWSSGRLRTGSGSAITNNGLWDIRTDQPIFNSDLGGAMSTFLNTATFRKSDGAGSALMDIPFTSNAGTIEVASGAVQFRNTFVSNAAKHVRPFPIGRRRLFV